jgi:predicted nucleotidyltransferase
MPGGFHPFHAGHMALYNSARQAFPNADLYVAATNSQEARPFPFAVKEKLAKVAGVEPGNFVQVKSPFQAKEITQNYNPEQDVLIFVRSEKDRNESPKPGGTKKDGSPAYFQPYTGKNMQPFSQHAYFAYLPTVKFGPGITSATEIRKAWPTLNDKRKTAMVMSLYPASQKNPKLAANIVGMLDQVMGGQEGLAEGKQPGQPVVDAILKVMPIAQEIWFHGSRAIGKHRRNSDTDILVVVPDDLVGDKYLGVVRILQKLSSHFDNYDIQPTKSGTNIHRIAQEEGRLLWSNNQGVAEGSEEKDNLIWTLNSFGYYSDNSSVYVNDNGDKIVRVGSEWKHQSGKRGRGPEELGAFLSSLQDVSEGFGLPMPSTYEQETEPLKSHGARRIIAMTNEDINMSKSLDYLEEK